MDNKKFSKLLLVTFSVALIGIIVLMILPIKDNNKHRNELLLEGMKVSYSLGYKECSQRLINNELKINNHDSLYKIDYKSFENFLEKRIK